MKSQPFTLKKLFTCLFLAAMVLALFLLGALFKMLLLQQHLNEVNHSRMHSYVLAQELRQDSDDLTRLVRAYTVTGDPKYEKQYLDILDIQDGKKPRPTDPLTIAPGQTIALEMLMKEAGFTEEEFAKLKEAKAKSDGLVATEVAAMNAVKGVFDDGTGKFSKKGNPDMELARKLVHSVEYQQFIDQIDRPIAEFLLSLSRRTEQSVALAKQTNLRIYVIVVGLVSISLLAGILCLIFVYRRLTHQLGGEPAYAVRIIEKIATGDLTVPIDLKTSDRSSILFSMRTMRDNLANLVAEVRSGTDAIAAGSTQIASGNQDLSSRTEEQASSLEETASSMEELTSSVRQYVENAQQANRLVESASGIAIKGGEVVSHVVETMGAIDASAKKIAEIISVIDGIAFQTNILALNAAVEAARAGELGRGFAVVASEVRSLAQRSAAAAKEIKTLITDSAGQVESGSKLVTEAGITMNEIVASVKSVNDIMIEIMHAGREQSAGIEQVNEAISQVDQVTQQNAALVEQVAAASESLQDQALKLTEMVGQFKLNDNSAHNPQPENRRPQLSQNAF